MPANLENFKTVVEAAWVGATPEVDGSGLLYRFVDTIVEERGNGNHRELCWKPAQLSQVVAQTPEQMEWLIQCELYLDRRNRTLRAFQTAVESESTELGVIFNGLTALGTSVWEAELMGFNSLLREPERRDRSGGISKATFAVVLFNFRVLVGEV
jgi:hypothetical protein